ncbi:MAG: carbohydrate kinase family protein [Anaerolineaceae bacterium]|nr:carbohydrate kinase family protein [Anaerolineaceae bacterium]
MKIICTGSVAFDYLMTFPGYFKDHLIPEALEKVSLSFLVDKMTKQRGGCAPNIAYTLALLGETPLVMATVGKDFEDYRRWLEVQGVDTQYIKVIEDDYTASFFANTDQSNAQIASFYTGAMAYSKDLSLKNIVKENPDLVLISPNDPIAMNKYVREAKELGISYLYDPSQQLARSESMEIAEGVMGAHSLFVNDYEIELLIKHTGFTEAQIKDHVKILVVTRGAEGSTIYADGKQYDIPVVLPKKIMDPTGVGDAYRGGFLVGYSKGFDLQTCGQMGSLSAIYCIEQKGTQNHFYTPEDFVARYREHFSDDGLLDKLL